ncbi:hypothetical protein JKF63_06273 [Porcisia hertigi]|uniref:Uncharacterized protein n=1 Tax=Porcisia hertigi TaxID=2761500 RepID=A0A836IU96_9TRYP|nr:hypothetical protein JKF63_06273 [Porcisia hertigi]
MSSDDGLREDKDVEVLPQEEVDVDVDAEATEEAPVVEGEQEPTADGEVVEAEDNGVPTATLEVPAEVHDSSQAAASLEHVGEEGGVQEDAAATENGGPPTEALEKEAEERAAGHAEVHKAAPPQSAHIEAVTDGPPPPEPKREHEDRTPSAKATPPPPPPPRKLSSPLPRKSPRSQRGQRPEDDLRHESTTASPPMAHSVTVDDVRCAHTMTEADRIAIAAASLTPNTALAVFRRGHENSHVNRMDIGSYSRYLLSTDHMSPLVFHDTFYGNEPTIGAVPRNTVEGSGRGNVNKAATDSITARVATSAPSARSPFQPQRSTYSAESQRFGRTFAGSAANSGSTRRELKMLDEANLSDLNALRDRRRRDPQHGKSAKEQQDYVYYNHRSKGFYVPHDPPAGTMMLHYNHLYSFGDGTRFAAKTPPLSEERGRTPGAVTTAHRHNPHAAPPRSFAETRGCAFPYTASQRQHASYNHTTGGTPKAISGLYGQGSRTQRGETQKGSSSLRTGKAVDLAQLHSTQCPRPRTIEEVMADQPQRYLGNTKGVGGALVRDIERDVEVGKLQWGEVPPAMQKAMASVATIPAAAQHSQQLAVDATHVAPGGTPAARGNSATKTWSMTPPSSALTAAARAPSAERMAGSTASSSRRIPIGSAAAAVALPAISRLNYTPRATKRYNPSAFV